MTFQIILFVIISLLQPLKGQNPTYEIEGTGWYNRTHVGYVGHFKIPLSIEIPSWWVALTYPDEILHFELWTGNFLKYSVDKKTVYMKNTRWNGHMYPGSVMDHRYHIELKANPSVDYSSYYGPRPLIIFRNNVYVPDQNAEGEHEMDVYDINDFDRLPTGFEMLPVMTITTPEPPSTVSTEALTKGPNSGVFWWVRTFETPKQTTTVQTTTTPTTTISTSTQTTTIKTRFSASCKRHYKIRERKCRQTKKMLKKCYLPQCSEQDRFKPVQCWKYVGLCWCVNPKTGSKEGNKFERYKSAHKLVCSKDTRLISAAPTTSSPKTALQAPETPVTTQQPIVKPIFAPRNNYDYNLLIHYSLLFYEAQRSGDVEGNSRIRWRKNAHTKDGSNCGYDLSGGYYVSGDYVKHGFPTAYSMAMLALGYVEFKDSYDNAGLTTHLKNALKWGADYFMKAHVSKFELVGQVGDSTFENIFWTRPENMLARRPCFSISIKNPGTDLAAETAAALAATALVWKLSGASTGDTYVKSLLQHAKDLYMFAKTYRGIYSSSIRNAADHYPSSGYGDELAWSALWLHRATGQYHYLAEAGQFYKQFDLGQPQAEVSWDNKAALVQVLLARFAYNAGARSQANIYQTSVNKFCHYNLPGEEYRASYTPQGLVYISEEGGATRYAANAAFTCLLASTLETTDNNLKLVYRQFAENQMDYILGKTGRSYVVGYGLNFPTRPHHRSSSCPITGSCGWENAYEKDGPNPNMLFGALVGGPDKNDVWKDDRRNFKQNSVSIDFNAGLQSLAAGLRHFQIEYKLWTSQQLMQG